MSFSLPSCFTISDSSQRYPFDPPTAEYLPSLSRRRTPPPHPGLIGQNCPTLPTKWYLCPSLIRLASLSIRAHSDSIDSFSLLVSFTCFHSFSCSASRAETSGRFSFMSRYIEPLTDLVSHISSKMISSLVNSFLKTYGT